jgi:hypothetical protein
MSTRTATQAAAVALATTKDGTPEHYRALAAFARSQTFRHEDGRPDSSAIDRRRLQLAQKALVSAKYARSVKDVRKGVGAVLDMLNESDDDLIARFRADNIEKAEVFERKAAEIEAATQPRDVWARLEAHEEHLTGVKVRP